MNQDLACARFCKSIDCGITLNPSMDPVAEKEKKKNLFTASLLLRSLLAAPAGYSLVVTSLSHIGAGGLLVKVAVRADSMCRQRWEISQPRFDKSDQTLERW